MFFGTDHTSEANTGHIYFECVSTHDICPFYCTYCGSEFGKTKKDTSANYRHKRGELTSGHIFASS